MREGEREGVVKMYLNFSRCVIASSPQMESEGQVSQVENNDILISKNLKFVPKSDSIGNTTVSA